MDDETKQAIAQLRARIATVNESLEITTDALGAFMEECNGNFASINETLQILVSRWPELNVAFILAGFGSAQPANP